MANTSAVMSAPWKMTDAITPLVKRGAAIALT
jgi:hypothetical protein